MKLPTRSRTNNKTDCSVDLVELVLVTLAVTVITYPNLTVFLSMVIELKVIGA